MLKKTIKLLVGLLCFLFCIGFTWQLGESTFSTSFKPDVPYLFVGGAIAYLVLHLLFKQPILTYVFGHELTHAFFALLFGGGVKSFRATERGGQVTVTKSNFVITLAPYFFPLYTFIVLLLYFLSSESTSRSFPLLFVFLAGASFMFHILLTLIFLQAEQKDIREEGAFFAYPLIFLFNILFAALLLHLLLARQSDFLGFVEHGIIKTLGFTVGILSWLFQ